MNIEIPYNDMIVDRENSQKVLRNHQWVSSYHMTNSDDGPGMATENIFSLIKDILLVEVEKEITFGLIIPDKVNNFW